MVAEVEQLERLQNVDGAGLGRLGAQHWIIEPRDRNRRHVRMVLLGEMDELQPIVFSEPYVDHDSVGRAIGKNCARILESLERYWLTPPHFEQTRERRQDVGVIIDDHDLTSSHLGPLLNQNLPAALAWE